MLFIMPAFLLCLLFTNLQPRFMILIYQQSTNSGIREIICKFNLFHYGTLFLIYPLLVLTNFNAILFIGMSLIAIPQIYLNGINGNRPDLTSPFYTRYLLTRLLVIVIITLLSCIYVVGPTMSLVLSQITSYLLFVF